MIEKAESMSTALDDGPRSGTTERTSVVLPDAAICRECRRELFDSSSRRFRFPFMSCAECGPRFEVLREPPFERCNTTMSAFTVCDRCGDEYRGETGRQSGNETIACPDCGPTLVAHDAAGEVQATGASALDAAVQLLSTGGVLAVKGFGGFSLMVNANDAAAVRKLRRVDERPLSVVFPGLESIEALCDLSAIERDALTSAAAPIVMLTVRDDLEAELPAALSNTLCEPRAAMGLPSTAVQCLLLADLEAPLAMTCGAGCGDSVCADEQQAVDRFRGFAGLFLDHDLAVTHAIPDSVVQVVSGRLQTLRAGRGCAPIRIRLEGADGLPDMVAVGGQRSNSVAASSRGVAVLGHHIGDLDALPVYETFRAMVGRVAELCEARPGQVIRDLHPDYLSSRYAESAGFQSRCCQHHLSTLR